MIAKMRLALRAVGRKNRKMRIAPTVVSVKELPLREKM